MTKKERIDTVTSRWRAVIMRVAELRQRLALDKDNYMEIMAEYNRAREIKIRWYNLLIRLLR